jgi:hypothetical protein
LNSTPKHGATAGSNASHQTQLLKEAICQLEVQVLEGTDGKLPAVGVPEGQLQLLSKQDCTQGGEPGAAADVVAVPFPQSKWAESTEDVVPQHLTEKQARVSLQAAGEPVVAGADGSIKGAVTDKAAAAAGDDDAQGVAGDGKAGSLPAGQSYEALHESVELLPRVATEGTVVPEATFSPADTYTHETSHKAVLALYELIGGCLSTNTDGLVEEIGLLSGGLGPVEEESVGGAVWGKVAGRESSSSASSGGVSSGGAGFLGGLLRGKSDVRSPRGTSQDGHSSSSRERGKSSLGGRGRSSTGKKNAGGDRGGGHSPGAAWFLGDDSGGGGSYNTAPDDGSTDDGSGDDDGDCGASTHKSSSSSMPKVANKKPGKSLLSSFRQKSPLSSCSTAGAQGSLADMSHLQYGGSSEDEAEVSGGYAALGGCVEPGGAAAGGGKADGEDYETLGASTAVRVRWYDARCRVAVKRVAHWLRVPWPKVRGGVQLVGVDFPFL